MSIIKSLFTGIIPSLLGIGHKSKATAAQPTATPIATRDDAAASQQAADDLRRRRGSADDILTGTAGAEAAPGIKLVAGS